jgi:hypothetical protein
LDIGCLSVCANKVGILNSLVDVNAGEGKLNRGDVRKYFLAPLGVSLAMLASLISGCGEIHQESNIGGVDTLSIDAKQRLMLVGNRGGISPKRVTCTEPSPDALVAKAAVLAATANVTPESGGGSGSGGISGGTSESAASIGFRDHTVQMLRDGYFRLCEAYLNGALTKEQYETMITNADTFMVVVSALQILGSNPVAPSVAITPGSISANTTPGTGTAAGATDIKITAPTANLVQDVKPGTQVSAESAKAAGEIVKAYLDYRTKLNKEVRAETRHRRQVDPQPE